MAEGRKAGGASKTKPTPPPPKHGAIIDVKQGAIRRSCGVKHVKR